MTQRKKTHTPAQLQKDLSCIENRLKKPVDQKTFQRLFQKLQKAQKKCSFLKSKYTPSSFQFLSGQEERICSLFGKIINTHTESEVERIVTLANCLKSNEQEKAISLQKEILYFKEQHRPSKEYLSKLFQAEAKIKAITNQQLPLKIEEKIFEISEEVENLLQLASFVYNKNKTERNKTYMMLSYEVKKRLDQHLISLKTQAFEKEESTIQALFASAFEFAGIEIAYYPTSQEIEDFFLEEKKILNEEFNK